MTESNERPQEVVVERYGPVAVVFIAENIQEAEREDETIYVYDLHEFRTDWREGLQEAIEADPSAWIPARQVEPPTVEQRVADVEAALCDFYEAVLGE